MELIENPPETQVDVALMDFMQDMREKFSEENSFKAVILKERAFQTKKFKLLLNLFTDSGMKEDAQMVRDKLLALLKSTPLEPAAPSPVSFRVAKADSLKERALKIEELKLQIELFTDSGTKEDVQMVCEELLALESTPPEPAAPALVPRPEC